jgi:hypothetical protein
MIIGNYRCAFNARSIHLQCAVNPLGDCGSCEHFEERSPADSFTVIDCSASLSTEQRVRLNSIQIESSSCRVAFVSTLSDIEIRAIPQDPMAVSLWRIATDEDY